MEDKPVKAVTGREIIESYLKGGFEAEAKYAQLCKSLEEFTEWSDTSKVEFLSQFLNISSLLDGNCMDLVAAFCNLKWHTVPKSCRQSFADFLVMVTLNHIVHIDTVFRSIVIHFIPQTEKDDSKIEDDLQEEIFAIAHNCVKSIVSCIPLAHQMLLECCTWNYPHFGLRPLFVLLGYNRNLILLSETYKPIARRLWSLIVDRLLFLDGSIDSRASNGDDELDNSNEHKLDLSVAQIIAYVSALHNVDNEFLGDYNKDINFKWIYTLSSRKIAFFEATLLAFKEHMLYAHDVHSISFIWFYLCSLSENTCHRMLNFLWKQVKEPINSPNEWKKAQNAAAFLCGFLARANYISFSTTSKWMKTMADWCCSYTDNIGSVKVNVGGVQHGTFYATVQALLFVLCYRCKEFGNVTEDVRDWGLDKVIRSKLEPLSYVSQAVALCFVNVCRFFKLEQYNHILSPEETLRQRPVELYFPFSFCTIKLSSQKLLPLMRKYSSFEDIAAFKRPCAEKEISNVEQDKDDDVLMNESKSCRVGKSNGVATRRSSRLSKHSTTQSF